MNRVRFRPSRKFKNELRQDISARYGGIFCLKCGPGMGEREDLEHHHIYSITFHPELAYEPENIIYLCHYHHVEFHQLYDDIEPYQLALYLNLTEQGAVYDYARLGLGY